jgi:hypothetical protein
LAAAAGFLADDLLEVAGFLPFALLDDVLRVVAFLVTAISSLRALLSERLALRFPPVRRTV